MGQRMGCQRSKQKILNSAREMFYHAGYHSTSVDDILKASGVAKSNFYYHFRSKEELVSAVVELDVQELEELLVKTLQDSTDTPAQRLQAFCAELCRLQVEWKRMGGCPFGNFAASLSDLEDESTQRMRQRLCHIFERVREALQRCMEEGAQRGQFRSDIPAVDLSLMALGAAEGLLILTKTFRDTTPLVTGLATLQRLFAASEQAHHSFRPMNAES
jgi:AcrR family transcriptional regulator